jgi:ATP-dependent Clp protease ATP-binding subunit ClpA
VLDRFSVQARRAVGYAGEEARRLGHPHVGTEHLLLGLLAGGENPASRLLRSSGAPLGACREKVSEALGRRDCPAPGPANGGLELTDRAARALDRAGKLSLRLKSDEVSTAHVLLSVLDVEGTAGQVLRGLNVDLTALREELMLAGPDGDSPVSPPQTTGATFAPDGDSAAAESPSHAVHAGVAPLCSTCGTPLQSAISRTVIESPAGVAYEVIYCAACGAALGATGST